MSLYEIATELLEVSEQLDEAEHSAGVPLNGHTAEALGNLLAAVQIDASQKAGGLVRWRENLLAEAEALDAEIALLKAKRDAKKRRAEGIKSYIADFMRVTGLTKLDAGVRSLSFRKGSKSLLVDRGEIENWNATFFDAAVKAGAVVPSYEVKVSLLKDLPDYLKQPGVREEIGEESLVIR